MSKIIQRLFRIVINHSLAFYNNIFLRRTTIKPHGYNIDINRDNIGKLRNFSFLTKYNLLKLLYIWNYIFIVIFSCRFD